MFDKIPEGKVFHPDIVSITRQLVDIYPKGHNDGKIRIKFYRLLQQRSKIIIDLHAKGECDTEGLVDVK